MIYAVNIVSSRLPMKSWVWQVIGGYLTGIECTQLQGVSSQFYKFLTPQRLCRSKLNLWLNYVFALAAGKKFSHSAMLLNSVTQVACLIENPSLDVLRAKSVVFNRALIALSYGSVAAYKYTSFDDPAKTVKSRLPNLPNTAFLADFSVCKLAFQMKIILSGGAGRDWEKSAKVHALDTASWKW